MTTWHDGTAGQTWTGRWQRPSVCESGGCASVLADGDTVLIRSSRRPEQIAVLDRQEWRELVAAIRAGEYDEI